MKLAKQTLLRTGVGLAAFAVVALPLAASAAVDSEDTVINANIGSTITISSVSPVTINLTPGGTPVLTTASDTVTVNTNSIDGYTLTLANKDEDTYLESADEDQIAAHTGTLASPSALAANSWGFAVAGLGTFDGSYSVVTNSEETTSKWAGVPASNGTAAQLKSTSSTATNDPTTVWYGVRVNSAQPTGSYSDTVTYTATTND